MNEHNIQNSIIQALRDFWHPYGDTKSRDVVPGILETNHAEACFATLACEKTSFLLQTHIGRLPPRADIFVYERLLQQHHLPVGIRFCEDPESKVVTLQSGALLVPGRIVEIIAARVAENLCCIVQQEYPRLIELGMEPLYRRP